MYEFIEIGIYGLLLGGLYCSISAGLAMQWGISRIVNFAYGDFLMIGAFVTYFMWADLHVPPLIAMLAAGGILLIVGTIAYALFLNRVLKGDEHNQLVATLGLSVLLEGLATYLWGTNEREITVQLLGNIHIGSYIIPGTQLVAALVGLGLYVIAVLIVGKTRAGLRMRLASDNPELASLTGIDVSRARWVGFSIGSALVGMSGALIATTVGTYPLVGTNLGMIAFAVVALGGLGSVAAAALGSILLGLAVDYIGAYSPNGSSYATGVAFALLVVVLIVRPTGLFGRAWASR